MLAIPQSLSRRRAGLLLPIYITSRNFPYGMVNSLAMSARCFIARTATRMESSSSFTFLGGLSGPPFFFRLPSPVVSGAMARSARKDSGQGGTPFRGPAGTLASAECVAGGPAATDMPRLPDRRNVSHATSVQSTVSLLAGPGQSCSG